jgi:uncharacterized Zn-finger protein
MLYLGNELIFITTLSKNNLSKTPYL